MLCIAKIALYRTFNPPAQLNKLDLQAKSPISHMPRIRVIHSIAENMIQKTIGVNGGDLQLFQLLEIQRAWRPRPIYDPVKLEQDAQAGLIKEVENSWEYLFS